VLFLFLKKVLFLLVKIT